MGRARMSEYSFKSHFGTLSVPDALLSLRLAKTFWTRSLLTVKNLGVSSRGKWASGISRAMESPPQHYDWTT